MNRTAAITQTTGTRTAPVTRTSPTRRRGEHRALWTVQALTAALFVMAALPSSRPTR